jgi:hypothetical protein
VCAGPVPHPYSDLNFDEFLATSGRSVGVRSA